MRNPLRIGLNGFGRIGRVFARIATLNPNIKITTINTAHSTSEVLAYLLQFDSTYGRFDRSVSTTKTGITLDDNKITCLNFSQPKEIPWSAHEVDLIIDCTGIFKTREQLSQHLSRNVKKVILSSPTNDPTIPHVVMGVNESLVSFEENDIISNASCTTNCAAPMFKLLNDNFGVVSGFLTTTHAYTSSQQLLDSATSELIRSRAAPTSIIPSTTGATEAVVKVIPELKDKIEGMSVRVPVPIVSFSDINCAVEKNVTIMDLNSIFKHASESDLSSIVAYETKPLVSSDYIGDTHSVIFDSNYTKVINGNFIKICGWYDNEWGYASRLVDLVLSAGKYI